MIRDMAESSKPTTRVFVLLDRSGSMELCKSDAEGGYVAFLNELRKEITGECLVTLHQFSTIYETVYADMPLADAPGVTLQPRGATALLDSIGRAISDGQKMAAQGDIVYLVIITDGRENASTEYGLEAVKTLIEAKEAAGWNVTYLGANQDAITVASTFGVAPQSSMTYDSQVGTSAAMASAGAAVGRSWRGGGSAVDYTSAERGASLLGETDLPE